MRLRATYFKPSDTRSLDQWGDAGIQRAQNTYSQYSLITPLNGFGKIQFPMLKLLVITALILWAVFLRKKTLIARWL